MSAPPRVSVKTQRDVASSALTSSRMPTKFLSLVVRPGERCKISLPGCSALELKQAALAPGGPITERVVLECDLAVKRFVLCSLVPRGPMQATLGTVVTNDPDQAAWLYLTARGPRPLHVIGTLSVDSREERPKKRKRRQEPAAATAAEPAVDATMGDDGMWESDWGLGAPVATSAKAAAADALLADTDADVGGRGIEVLLPDGEQELDAPSDADSEDFVRWMQSKVETEAAEPKAKVGGGRAARRRAAARRVEAGADAPPDAEPAAARSSNPWKPPPPAERGGGSKGGGRGRGRGRGAGRGRGRKGR